MAVERRTGWLGAALIVAVMALVVVRSMGEALPPAPERAPASRSPGRSAAPAEAETAPDVKLALLSQSRGEPAESARNPFRFRPKPPPPAPMTPRSATEEATSSPAPPPAPPGPPPLPPIPLKFIGLVQKADGTRIAVLSDGKRPYYGVEGQELEGQYRILKIGQESIDISYIDGRGRLTLRLNGK